VRVDIVDVFLVKSQWNTLAPAANPTRLDLSQLQRALPPSHRPMSVRHDFDSSTCRTGEANTIRQSHYTALRAAPAGLPQRAGGAVGVPT